MAGIIGYGAYVPRMQLSRQAIYEANAWFAPSLKGKAKGARAFANWDEDSITMAVAAARDCVDVGVAREAVTHIFLASTSHPFVERSNAGLISQALRLKDEVEAYDLSGSSGSALTAFSLIRSCTNGSGKIALLLAADCRKARAGGGAELSYGDAAACLLWGNDGVIADLIGYHRHTVDFVDQFRKAASDYNYEWEERWVRDEGVAKLVPLAIGKALENAGVCAGEIDRIVLPIRFSRMDRTIAKMCGLDPERLSRSLESEVGDSGAANTLLHLTETLQKASPGENILVADFAGGATAVVLRTTQRIAEYAPRRGVGGWLARGKTEVNYTKYLAFRGMLDFEKGIRGEQDKKTALSTLYRHRKAILGFVAGRCRETGSISFPPSRLSYDPQGALLDSQDDYPLAERRGKVLSCSAEYLSSYPSPPHQYGQIDFEGGGRVLMEFTDVDPGEVDSGTEMEMVFRIKDNDGLRGFTRYCWKATPSSREGED